MNYILHSNLGKVIQHHRSNILSSYNGKFYHDINNETYYYVKNKKNKRALLLEYCIITPKFDFKKKNQSF